MIEANITFLLKLSKWVANLVLVQKKNRDIRLCVDFCALNRASVKDNFTLSNMELSNMQALD
jgi:hypothetical protein